MPDYPERINQRGSERTPPQNHDVRMTEQVAAILAAGPGATVHHPNARGRRVREIKQALGRAGVPHRLVQTLGYSTTGPAPAPASEDVSAPKKAKRRAGQSATSESSGSRDG